MEDHEKCIRQRDIAFTKRLVWLCVGLFVASIILFVCSVHIDNYIDDQINMYEHDCKPSSIRAQELMMDECNKAKVYAESARWVARLMFIFYYVTDGINAFFEWTLTNITAIGGTVLASAAGLAVRKYFVPGLF